MKTQPEDIGPRLATVRERVLREPLRRQRRRRIAAAAGIALGAATVLGGGAYAITEATGEQISSSVECILGSTLDAPRVTVAVPRVDGEPASGVDPTALCTDLAGQGALRHPDSGQWLLPEDSHWTACRLPTGVAGVLAAPISSGPTEFCRSLGLAPFSADSNDAPR